MSIKVLLIGKLNDITKELSEHLTAEGCQVQLCSDSAEITRGMLKLTAPDLAVISLVGALTAHEEIFSLLFHENTSIRVVAIGSRGNEQDLEEMGLLQEERLHFIRRPVTMNEIVQQINALAGVMDVPPESGPKQELEPEHKHKARDRAKTILVVDDSPVMLRTMQSMLSSQQYRVIFATSGPQAIATIAKDRPDLILLDYEMPVVNGKMTLEMLRSEDSTREIPVVFLTGMNDKKYVEEIIALKPEGYLLKPPSEERIFETIEQILGKPNSAARG